MLLTQDDVPAVSKSLDMPVLSVELERAIWQVETALDEGHSKGSEKKQDEKKADDKEKQS